MTPETFIALRKSMGFSQHTLAEALRMGKHGWQTISGWENGRTLIPGPVQIAMEHLAHCRNRKTAGKLSAEPSNDGAGGFTDG